jgi:hypothetical protein
MNRTIVFMLVLSLVWVVPVSAQEPPPFVAQTVKPISSELKDALDAWLAVSPPSDAPYYIVTYTRTRGTDTVVSLAGVDLPSPDAEWSFEDGTTTVWIGTVIVSDVGEVSPLSVAMTTPRRDLFASISRAPLPAPGGGSYLTFPFQQGSTAMYGPRGVHDAGYGTSGMVAVDLVGGDDMGASAMPPYVFASDAGIVDYVCDDGTSVAVRTYNEDTGDYFIYAHMLDNENLEIDVEFGAGEMLGSLKYGSFDPTHPNCGWAEQASNHYHVHWGIVPASGRYQAAGCLLTVSSQTWDCGGGETVRVGEYLAGGGGYTGGTSTTGSGQDGTAGTGSAGVALNTPTFWDYMLAGLLSIVDKGLIQLLPEHEPFEFTYVIFNVISLVFRMVWVFAASNVSFVWLFRVILVGMTVKAVFGILWVVAFIFKAWKSVVPILGA